MRMTSYFIPLLKETPKGAEIVSHQLMLRSGLIDQHTSGIYTWLPLGLRVLRKIMEHIRQEQERIGAVEVLMPTIQSADLWNESGRYDVYGKEMLRFCDRHGRDMLYGPTNEEMITDIFRRHIRSYKDIPLTLYQMQWKFRDEIRPRFGVMRGREFLMKDAYSFGIDEAAAQHTYYQMFGAYLRTFSRMGLRALPVQADPGAIGGNMSHEFMILAQTGESKIYCDKDILALSPPEAHLEGEALSEMVAHWMRFYAASDECHDPEHFSQIPKDKQSVTRGIEVGHIFYFGTKYAQALHAFVADSEGAQIPVHMGSYGIGISRLVAAVIEANHDEKGIIWPVSVAPFTASLLNLKQGDAEVDSVCLQLYTTLTAAGIDVLYDDRPVRGGEKFAGADLMGLPFQIVVGPRSLREGAVEIIPRGKKEQSVLVASENVCGYITHFVRNKW